MKKISVALASYEGREYILEQLESIAHQTRMPDEVIISDDCSTDGTYEIVEKWIVNRKLTNIFKLQKNKFEQGVYGNFYSALNETCGDIILLSDQDDVWELDKVEKIEEAFEGNDDIKCINTGFLYIDENGCRIHDKRSNKPNHGMIPFSVSDGDCVPIPMDLVLSKNISPGMTMAVSREVIDLYLKCSSRSALHDWELNCIAASVWGGGIFSE